MQLFPCPLGDNPGDGRLADAGGAVEDHIGDNPPVDDPGEGPVRAQQVFLADDVLEGLRAQPVGQR